MTENKLLAPVTNKQFFNAYWEQKPLHVARSDSGYFDELLTVDKIEQLLSVNELVFPRVQATQADKAIEVSSYTDADSRIIPSRLLELHAEGATLVVSQAHQLVPSLATLCREAHTSLQLQCQANFYYSPAGCQGFKAHYDTHDVMILQVAGKKTFNFYSAAHELPMQHQRFDSTRHDKGELTDSIELTAGDTLYIPRGFVHDAVADADQDSLHITLGVYAVTMQELLNNVLAAACERDHRFRQSIPREHWSLPLSGVATESSQPMTALLVKLLGELADADKISEALSGLRDDVALSCQQELVSQLGKQNKPLTMTSTIRLRAKSVMSVETTRSGIKLRSQGRVLEFQQPMASAVAWLLEAQSALVSELPGLSDVQRAALVERLVSENIVDCR